MKSGVDAMPLFLPDNLLRGQGILIHAIYFGINFQQENPDSMILSDAFSEKSMKYLMSSKDIASVLFLRIHSSTFKTRSVKLMSSFF
jgi:hypothetical protein